MLKIDEKDVTQRGKPSTSFPKVVVGLHVGASLVFRQIIPAWVCCIFLRHTLKKEVEIKIRERGCPRRDSSKKSMPRDYANRKSLRTGDPENSGFNSIQLNECVSPCNRRRM